MTETASLATLTVRTVWTRSSTEFHAETCGHRIPRDAEVISYEMDEDGLRATDQESLDLNAERVVKPCLRKILGIK